MDFSKEVLDQINGKKEEMQRKQSELRKLLEETQAEIDKNEEDISACEHLLARCGYEPCQKVAEVVVEQFSFANDVKEGIDATVTTTIQE